MARPTYVLSKFEDVRLASRVGDVLNDVHLRIADFRANRSAASHGFVLSPDDCRRTLETIRDKCQAALDAMETGEL